MPIIDGAYVAPTWNNNASPAIDATELQAMSNTIEGNQGKAPQSHASPNTTYGVGNASNYGHVKLSDTPSNAQGVTSGVAASPKAVYGVKQTADSAATAAAAAQATADTKARAAVRGFYLGTGTYGVNAKSFLDFSAVGVPEAIILMPDTDSPYTGASILFPKSGQGQNLYANARLFVSVAGTTVYWYSNSNPITQFSAAGVTYHYVALY